MKKTLKLAILLITVIVANSCSSNDSVGDNSIYHKWYYKERIQNGVTTPYYFGNCGKDYALFYGGNRIKFVSIINCQPMVAPATFSLDGNSITITNISNFETTTSTGEITELTMHNLTIVYNYTFDENGQLIIGYAERYER